MKTFPLVAAIAASVFAAAAAHANLVTNGNFSQTTYATNSEFGTVYGGQGVTGWTGNNGYNLFFIAPTATTTSANSQFGGGNEYLYGSGGDTDPNAPGSNFVALDGNVVNSNQGGISQTVNGLVVGQTYQLSFDWGVSGLRSRGYNASVTEQLQVSLGSATATTAAQSITGNGANSSTGFSGWFTQAYTFTATSSSELLSFLSLGTPTNAPPIATLDNISLVAVPEPVSFALLGAGLVGLGAVRRRRRQG